MKSFTKMIMVCVGVLFTVVLFSSMAFAGTGSVQQPPGEPPYGVAIQSDAQGIKLSGVASIEYYNFRETVADVRIVLRLRKGNIIKVLYGEVKNIDTNLPAANQDAITNTMKPKVIDAFFNGDYSLQVTLKSLEEFEGIDTSTTLTGFSSIYLVDIVIAVK